jgi:hypothetical protein
MRGFYFEPSRHRTRINRHQPSISSPKGTEHIEGERSRLPYHGPPVLQDVTFIPAVVKLVEFVRHVLGFGIWAKRLIRKVPIVGCDGRLRSILAAQPIFRRVNLPRFLELTEILAIIVPVYIVAQLLLYCG